MVGVEVEDVGITDAMISFMPDRGKVITLEKSVESDSDQRQGKNDSRCKSKNTALHRSRRLA